MSSYKQVIVIREDLGMSKGKMISQSCHASLKAAERASEDSLERWNTSGAKKVVLSQEDRSIETLFQHAKRNKLPAYLVNDAGRTEVESGAKTALAIGPAEASKIDEVTGELSLIG